MVNKVHAVLYTKPHCVQCKMSTKVMDEVGLPYENTYYGNSEETNSIEVNSINEQKRTWSEKKVEKIKAKYGIQSLPLIKIIDDETEEELEYWSGFKPDRIKYWQTVNREDK
ncbi:thioredoxin fold domain-containing protein [Enterococcus faecalis]|uniref:thioredoxin fold domain-containing protein n=1 Tax=Enterococcus faecalis TaxID=1351 RepID=UPI0025B21BB6|nr:thioredoxin fold domain-containing protein [Enterococcus faecalis]MDN3077077.1 thioredoxin fold domain-containing protein [Enterococcus faecalis]